MSPKKQVAGATVRVALAGQPNVGKSTVFNLLTGLNQRVGNWPGKTIEKKTGTFRYKDVTFEITDLPGTYSLTANSTEEIVARDFIIKERPDIVVAIIGAATLERNLYLVAELLPLPSPVIVGLNMMDVASEEGMRVEPHVLEAALGVRVVPMIATRSEGVQELVEAMYSMVTGKSKYSPTLPQIRSDHAELLRQIKPLIADHVPPPYPEEWVALKLLEGDREITRMMAQATPPDRWQKVQDILRAHDDALVAVAGGRYEWIERMVRAAVIKPQAGQVSMTTRLDRIATHPLWGLLFLGAILALVFFLTYSIGTPMQELIDKHVIGRAADAASACLGNAPPWLSGLVVDGIIGGVGSVLTFLPVLLIFFAVMGVLEDVGYMARAAYVMDNFMHAMGLHGKSFLPLFLGFGCNVPAVMGTRIIESEQSRVATIMLAPLVPCTARLAVLAFLAPAFFGRYAFWVSVGLIGSALSLMALSGILINRVLFRSQRTGFIMELPLYHLPNWRTILMLIWQRTLAFVKKAGTLILVVSVAVWLLSFLPYGDIENSYLATIGRWLEPISVWMGFGWKMNVALLTSFIAKENAVATLGVLYGTGEEGLADAMRQIGPAVGLGFLTMQMLFIPCVSTVAAIKQETNSWKWTLIDLAYLLVMSTLMGVLAFQVASRVIG